MAKKTVRTKPARGQWEITLRNLRALKKQLAALDVRVQALEQPQPIPPQPPGGGDDL